MYFPIITLTTDFGDSDGFTASMKGVIFSIDRRAMVVDAMHNVPSGNVAHASFALAAFVPYFPPDSIHVVVVDPGVGAGRKPLVVISPEGTRFVGPDNGVFSHVFTSFAPRNNASYDRPFLDPALGPLPQGFKAYQIENRAMFDLSHTFHGRDVFAPIAVNLASGTDVCKIGPSIESVVTLNLPPARRVGNELLAKVQFIDQFGNAATDINEELIQTGIEYVSAGGCRVPDISNSYISPRGVGCVIASHGFLEIFVTGGSAAEKLGMSVGDEIRVMMSY